MTIPPLSTLQLLVQKKLHEGLTRPEVAALLRKRLHWNQLEPDKMDSIGRERYRLAREMIRDLETR